MSWDCYACEVGGVDVGEEPTCWSCGGPVYVHSIRRYETVAHRYDDDLRMRVDARNVASC